MLVLRGVVTSVVSVAPCGDQRFTRVFLKGHVVGLNIEICNLINFLGSGFRGHVNLKEGYP